ncbi:hypothetical protein GGI24_006368, partial [Coemansia furcata]
ELVRAVIERFLDAAPSNIASAMPEVVVATAMRIDEEEELATLPSISLPPRNNFQALCSQIMRDNHGCDEYVDDCLARVRAAHLYTAQCWQPKLAQSADPADSIDAHLAEFYPGAFLSSLVAQFGVAIKRHMAYNLMLTSMVNKLACIADPALSAFLFLANSATMPTSNSQQHGPMLYDALVAASADAYVKSERVPRFSARLARQKYEGVETAIKVGAAHPMSHENRAQKTKPNNPVTPKLGPNTPSSPLSSSSAMDVDPPPPAEPLGSSSREDVARAVKFLGTPIKRFVHGFIVLDEFAKEMAATALALHTLELDCAMDRQIPVSDPGNEDYADLLEYFDPDEPAYRRAASVQQSLSATRKVVINLGTTEDVPMAAREEQV